MVADTHVSAKCNILQTPDPEEDIIRNAVDLGKHIGKAL